MKKKITIWGILAALLLTGIFIYLKKNSQDTFFGSRIKNPDSYLLDISQMTGTDTHTLELEKGNTLKIQFEKEKGQLKLEIKAPDGTAVYEGNGENVTDFKIEVPMDGEYTIFVKAKNAQGKIHVQLLHR